MAEDIKWLIGVIVAAIMAIGGLLARDRSIVNQIRDGDEHSRKEAKQGDDALHERVNRVRDDYVRRVDLDGHMDRIDKNMGKMREEIRENAREHTARLDALISALGKRD